MKKIFLFYFLLIVIVSCKTTIDKEYLSSPSKNKGYYFLATATYNYFEFYPTDASADRNSYYSTNFKFRAPKGLIWWKQSGNNFFFEYDYKQIILIKTSFINSKSKEEDWKLKDFDIEENFSESLFQYWREREFSENSFFKKRKNRKSVIYSNGKHEIILFNIKQKNLEQFLYYSLSFEEMPRKF